MGELFLDGLAGTALLIVFIVIGLLVIGTVVGFAFVFLVRVARRLLGGETWE